MYILNRSDKHFNIEAVEEKYSATYMGMWCLRTISEQWAEVPSYIFYTPNPDTSLGHTNYFGLFTRAGTTYITKGDSAFTDLIGVVSDEGEVVISRYRHDYHISNDASVFIDGGRDYTRAAKQSVDVEVRDGEFYIGGEVLERKTPCPQCGNCGTHKMDCSHEWEKRHGNRQARELADTTGN